MFDGGEKENPSREDPLPHRHHTGDVIIEGDDVYGDGVNVAARLEDLARPGGICVAWPAYHQFMGKLPAGFGAQEVKNIARAVEAWRLGT